MSKNHLLDEAVGHHRAGRLDEAEVIYEKLLDAHPGHGDVLNLLATLARQRGRLDDAIDLARRAIATRPNVADFHFNLAEACRADARLQEAIGAYVESLRLNPEDAEACHGLGIAYARLGRHESAVSPLRRAIALRWNYAEAHEALATSLAVLGEHEQAVAACRKSLAMFPDRAQAHLRFAAVMASRGDLKMAGAAYSKAAQLAPASVPAHLGMAQVFNRLGVRDKAEEWSRKALALDPDCAEAHNHLGLAAAAQSNLAEAVAAFTEAIRLTPNAHEPHGNLAGVMLQLRDHDKGIALYRKAAQLAPDSAADHSNLLLAMNYPDTIGPSALFAEHVRWAALHAERLMPFVEREPRRAGDRVRVGYLSPDFREHPVSYFIEPILAAHDREQFEITIYNDAARPDAATARLRAHVPDWKDVCHLNDQRLADLIRADRIDILVDLAGHTAGNRLLVFARRPAPVQVTYLGYPNTTGLPRHIMQYRLTDERCDPPGDADAFHTEKLVRLPGAFLCYTPPLSSPDVAPPPSAKIGRITFGSFTSMQKVTPRVVEAWSKILQRVPDSGLLLKNKALADDGAWAGLIADFAARGIDGNRLARGKPTRAHDQHLAGYADMDIALDTFPYNGTTTIYEALWMGVPVVALAGNTHRARVGMSLLSSAGLSRFIADTADAYVDAAVALALDPARLSELRAELRERIAASPLTQRENFTKALELRYIWVLAKAS